ncbi:YcaO-like family protein [Streptomyces atratus]|uniref:YcaO-like family protein n=1 Tax=Streptomyces atratus TaxID=1893 RepID=UPI002255D8DD|nr:YcaO-like family protein [Streptomyces atratus]MCX5343686.1 YcaO-like family protein [Streptomyces atratus]
MRKAYFDGTHRTRHPDQTWESIRPLLMAYGITRVADVTGLDDLGIPVTMAVRPLARTLSVAQGKGATLSAARVSGAMEAIEAWHGERAVPTAEVRAPADGLGLDLPYPVTTLESHPGSLVTGRTVLDWITARSALDGEPVLVPAACVQLGREVHGQWRLHLPSASTNGLASGDTRAEAVVHALAELIERDTISALADGRGRGQLVDPDSIEDEHCAALIGRVRAAGVWLELWHLPNGFGVPVMSCYMWREDQPALLVSGSGAHLDPHVALSRAIAEAAQSRLTQIAGSREDILAAAYRPAVHRSPKSAAGPAAEWAELAAQHTTGFATDDGEAEHLAARVAAVTGHPPLVVDLTHGLHQRREFAVVKVLAPTLRYDARHVIPRPTQEAAA